MKISIDVLFVAGVSYVLGIAACASEHVVNEEARRMPSHWAVMPAETSKDCGPIDGVYRNEGLLHSDQRTQPAAGRFDVALGQPMPSARLPEKVTVHVHEDSHQISFQLQSRDSISYSRTFVCANGWYVLRENQEDKYLSDGVNMEYSHHSVELAKSADGGVIVHSVTNARFRTAGAIASDERVEAWYRFEKLTIAD